MLRSIVASLVLVGLGLGSNFIQPDSAHAIELTDMAGRTVDVDAPVERAILGEGRQIYMLATLYQDNPIAKVVGWRNDFRLFDHDTYKAYLAKFPAVADVEEFGNPYEGGFSVEKAISLDSDVVILPLGNLTQAKESGIIHQLEEVGIPVVFVDFRERPLENTIPSVSLMGRLFGREVQAQAVTDFYTTELNRVYARAATLAGDPPTVFLERAAGFNDECCRTWGRESLGLMVERAGGTNIGSELLPGATGTLNPEELIVSDPDVIIVTGANWTQSNPNATAVSLGAGADDAAAQKMLTGLASRPGFDQLKAVQTGQFHSIWHQFYNSPYNFVAIQAFAKWLHPDEFADIDPDDTFRRFHEQFLPVEYTGGYWASLDQPPTN